MKLGTSVSEKNVYLSYVCLVKDVKPNGNMTTDHDQNRSSFHLIDPDSEEIDKEDEPIKVGRTRALHELIETHKNDKDIIHMERDINKNDPLPCSTTVSSDDNKRSENEESDFLACDNPNILKLTRMKWLSNDRDGSPDASSPSLSSSVSTTSSNYSRESEEEINNFCDKHLSTILRLDKEHNMFGLSNITIVGSKLSRKIRKDDDKPVFHQTAIVQVCCGSSCCRHKSNTDLPASLKCGGCQSCMGCFDPTCPVCAGPCGPPCADPPCPPLCSSCPKGKCKCKSCPPVKCMIDCTTCFGMKIKVNRKPICEPGTCELTPRSSCILKKPIAARSCHHLPQCIPPSSCLPYLMPCYWPARASAPCNNPAQCFHNPPCLPPRKRYPPCLPSEKCPPSGKCEDAEKQTKCPNPSCPGNNPTMRQELETRFGKH